MIRALLRNRQGSGAAEFALVLPILILLLFGMIDTGRYMWEHNRAEKATMMGARMAVVTDVVASDFATTNYVVAGGLTQGDPIPPSALGLVTCDSSSCVCTTTPCPATTLARNATSFAAILTRMQLMYPPIVASNLKIEYRGSGIGYAGDPSGMQIAPLVTIRLSNLQFRPLSFLMLTHLTMPDFATTLTAEDSVGSQSN